MLFQEVPKLTRVGSYQISLNLSDLKDSIDRYIKNYNLQLEPDFQRGHVWDESKQIKYVEFLLKGGNTNNVLYFNHPNWMNSFKGEFVLVDGLQRVTACLKFLNGELKAFNQTFNQFGDTNLCEAELLININNLKTRAEVLKWYIDINTGGVVHTDDEINKVINLYNKELKSSKQQAIIKPPAKTGLARLITNKISNDPFENYDNEDFDYY